MPDRDGGLMIWGGPSALCVITVERTTARFRRCKQGDGDAMSVSAKTTMVQSGTVSL